jgi:hypothetical protein
MRKPCESIFRTAYSPSEFAKSCNRHPSWGYRQLYSGRIKAVTVLGRILIPASELDRIMATAAAYNPTPKKRATKAPKQAEALP